MGQTKCNVIEVGTYTPQRSRTRCAGRAFAESTMTSVKTLVFQAPLFAVIGSPALNSSVALSSGKASPARRHSICQTTESSSKSWLPTRSDSLRVWRSLTRQYTLLCPCRSWLQIHFAREPMNWRVPPPRMCVWGWTWARVAQLRWERRGSSVCGITPLRCARMSLF